LIQYACSCELSHELWQILPPIHVGFDPDSCWVIILHMTVATSLIGKLFCMLPYIIYNPILTILKKPKRGKAILTR